MTANAAAPAASSAGQLGQAFRRIRFRPAEGWLSLFATAVMVVVFAGSLIDAAWTPPSAGETGFLVWAALAGLALGVLGAKLGWGRWRTHIVGAVFGGLLLPLVMGGLVIGPDTGWDPGALANRIVVALDVVRSVWVDLVVQGRPYTEEYAHYHLVFGTLVWGAGMLAGYTVFGHRRPLDAVVVLGLAILANMALTERDQLTLIVLFSAGALLLLIRTHVFEEEVVWARRKIGDPAVIGQLYLRGGAAFVTAAVLGSVLLTATASSAPLQSVWRDLPSYLQDVSQFLQRIAPPGGNPRPVGVSFGSKADTSGVWEPSSLIAFRARFQPQENARFKWRAGTYSVYTGFGWEWGPDDALTRTPTAPRDPLPAGQSEATDVGRRSVTFAVTPDSFRDRTILGPNLIYSVDRPTEGVAVGPGGWFTSLESGDATGGYSVIGRIPVRQDVPGGLTEPRLRFAGTDYPPGILETYAAPPDAAAMGEFADALLVQIRSEVRVPEYADPDNVYDLVRTMQDHLRDEDNFSYTEDVRELRRTQCQDVSTVECFARIRQGYCEFYASTMAVLLREAGIPARVAYGFLPGERGQDGLEIVGAWGAHWWVEVYFPGEIDAWVEFDPTGGDVGQPQAIPSGSVGPSANRPSLGPATAPPEPTEPSNAPLPPGDPPGNPIGPLIAITLILGIGVLALAYAAYRRTPAGAMHPDQAWGSLAKLAARFGLGPRPSQTVYEYAGALGDAVPDARVELTTIARAKVEVAYGKRDLGADRLKTIAEAYRRLQFAIISLVLRRGLRRGRRR